ncbi:MAG: enoyl-CoA hydratase [Solirubrobacterales bacterium]|nr:enoyl-CoA hydratase [Solirubrobacterales bacterium]
MTDTTAPATSYELRGSAAWIRLTRPEKMNAIDADVVAGLNAGLDRALSDQARTVVLTGTGRVFCAGADLKAALRGLDDLSAIEQLLAGANAVIRRLAAHPAPVIAAVNGLTIAGGLELVLACDLVVAAEDAPMGDGHATYGVLPGGGASVRLPQRIGAARAKELLFTGTPVSAAEMHRLGLVNRVVPADQLETAVDELCATLATRSRQMLAAAKDLVEDGLGRPVEEALDHELAVLLRHLHSTDVAEGLAAFSEGRRPVFA